jgi:DNA-binding transcriptional regulator YiaG
MNTATATAEVRALARIRQMARDGRARSIREGAAIGVAELSRYLGCDPRSIRRWEEGERIPSERLAFKWLALLDALATPEDSDAA